MDLDPIGTERRAASRRSRLRGATACAVCGETELAQLVPASRSLLEFHHVGGISNDPDLGAALCKNHHAWLTELQLRERVDLRHDLGRTELDRLANALVSVAIFLDELALACRRWSDLLRQVIEVLDRRVPDWREWIEPR